EQSDSVPESDGDSGKGGSVSNSNNNRPPLQRFQWPIRWSSPPDAASAPSQLHHGPQTSSLLGLDFPGSHPGAPGRTFVGGDGSRSMTLQRQSRPLPVPILQPQQQQQQPLSLSNPRPAVQAAPAAHDHGGHRRQPRLIGWIRCAHPTPPSGPPTPLPPVFIDFLSLRLYSYHFLLRYNRKPRRMRRSFSAIFVATAARFVIFLNFFFYYKTASIA
ncbi:hypothetical protein BOX15_Mlig016480g2, partial [Macrostomum lignano]